MEEQWQVRIKDAFRKLSEFIKTHSQTIPYDKTGADFIMAEQLLRRIESFDLKKAMKDFVLGSGQYEGKTYPIVQLMKGLGTGENGFMVHGKEKGNHKSGIFIRANWTFQFNGKQTDAEGKLVAARGEISYRALLDNMRTRYGDKPGVMNDFRDAWYYSVSCLADGFSTYIMKYCTEEIPADDRAAIRNLIPKELLNIQPMGNAVNMDNIFLLIERAANNDFASEMLKNMGINSKSVSHFINSAKSNFKDIKIDELKESAMDAMQTGDVDRLAPAFKNLMTNVAHFIPVVDEGDTDEQD